MNKKLSDLKSEREAVLVMILNLLKCTQPLWRARYDFLAESFSMKPSRFRTVREGRKHLSQEEVDHMRQVLGEPGLFVKFEVLMKG